MNEITTTKKQPFTIVPRTLEEAMIFADKIANSSLCPNAYKGKGGDVLIAMQMGAEIGLSPMQAIQNIAVINGRPCVWGDAAIGIARAHPRCEAISEWMDGKVKDGTAIAYCEVKRKGEKAQTRSFSIENAVRAHLWEKAGTWKLYPERMLQMRARGFALRDVFPDALKGLSLAEEIIDLPNDDLQEIKPDDAKPKGVEKLKSVLGISYIEPDAGEVLTIDDPLDKPVNDEILETIKLQIDNAENELQLLDIIDLAQSLPDNYKEQARKFYREKKASFYMGDKQ